MKLDFTDEAETVVRQIVQIYRDEGEDVPEATALRLAIVYALIGISDRLDRALLESEER